MYTFEGGYYPELDMSLVLVSDKAFYYQSLIGVMKWMIEIGHIVINIELSLSTSHSAMSNTDAFYGSTTCYMLLEAQV